MKIKVSDSLYVRVTPITMAVVSLMLSLSLATFSVKADLSVDESGALQQTIVSEDNPNVGWKDFLRRSKLKEGMNTKQKRGEDYTFLVASGSAPVGGKFADSWISERNAAYEIAVISAKATIAQHLDSVMNSNRGIQSLMPARDAFVPEIQGAIDQDVQLSLMQKEQNLEHFEIDEQIRRFDPAWDGTGKDDVQRADKLVELRQVLKRKLEGRANELVKGALPIFSAEGYDDRGQYLVFVGLAWSPQSIAMAKSLLDPAFPAPAGDPDQPISDTLADMLQEDPDALTGFTGVRVWRDENGVQVLVSAAASARGYNDGVTRRRNAHIARGYMTTFLNEKINVDQTQEGEQTTDSGNGQQLGRYEQTSYDEVIEGSTGEVRLQGVAPVYEWIGTHPVSGVPMLVSILSWSPESRSQAAALKSMADKKPASRVEKEAGSVVRNGARRGIRGPEASFEDY